jgi:hypothetical protein
VRIQPSKIERKQAFSDAIEDMLFADHYVHIHIKPMQAYSPNNPCLISYLHVHHATISVRGSLSAPLSQP